MNTSQKYRITKELISSADYKALNEGWEYESYKGSTYFEFDPLSTEFIENNSPDSELTDYQLEKKYFNYGVGEGFEEGMDFLNLCVPSIYYLEDEEKHNLEKKQAAGFIIKFSLLMEEGRTFRGAIQEAAASWGDGLKYTKKLRFWQADIECYVVEYKIISLVKKWHRLAERYWYDRIKRISFREWIEEEKKWGRVA